jgi:lipoprotein-anchoring transpeptidase ErfK/SrfK
MIPAHGGNRRWLGGRSRAALVAVAIGAIALAGCSHSGKQTADNTPGGSNGGSSSSGSSDSSSTGTTTPAGPDAGVTITPAAAAHTNPTTPIVVRASKGTLQAVQVTNPKGLLVTGQYAADKTSWSSNEVLGYGRTYKIAVTAKDKSGQVTHQAGTVTTINPKTAFPNVIPPPTANNIGVGMPLTVRFGKPITAIKDKAAVQKMLSVTSDPPQQGAWYWLSPTEVAYRGADYWRPNSTLTLRIRDYGKDLGGGVYGETDRTIPYHVHDAWIAYADGNTEQMVIKQNGVVVKTMPISMGKQSTPTHLGKHVISAKDRVYKMNSCTYGVCSGPASYISNEYYAERISDDGEFVHENPNSVGAQGSTNVSHGCINLNEANAQWFFSHMGVGDVVEVTNSGGPQLPLSDWIGVWSVSWPAWQAGNATS